MQIIKLDCIDSTNRYTFEELDFSKTAEYTVVWTSCQYAGRGQVGNIWLSEPEKNVCFSMVLYPEFLDPAHQFMLTKVLSLAMLQFFRRYITDVPVKIKWPNDIYAGSQKIAGILTENKIIGDTFRIAVTGIGINVNQTVFPSSAGNPSSISLHTGKTYTLDPLVEELRTDIIQYYQLLKEREKDLLDKVYLNNLLFFEELRTYEYKGSKIEAAIKGVTLYGFLEMQTTAGELLTCSLKEIKYLFPS